MTLSDQKLMIGDKAATERLAERRKLRAESPSKDQRIQCVFIRAACSGW